MKRIPTSGQWSEISKLITNNFELISADILELQNSLHSGTLGYFDTLGTLQSAYPNPSDGSRAFVGTSAPYKVYYYTDATGWYDTGATDNGSEGVAQIKRLSLNTSTKNTTIVATMSDGTSLSVALPNYTDITQSGKWGLIEGYDYDSLITLKGLKNYVQRLIEVAQRGADALIAFQFGGIVNGVTPETSSTIANSGFVVYDNTLQRFLLLVRGLPSKYYLSWAGGAAAESSTVWNGDEESSGRRVNGSRFYTTNEDGTFVWHYYDDGTMYKVNGEVDSYLSDTSTNAVQNKVVTEALSNHEERMQSLEATSGTITIDTSYDANGSKVGADLKSCNGLTLDSNALSLRIGSGLTSMVIQNGITELAINLGSGFSTVNDKLTVNLGSGFFINDSNRISLDVPQEPCYAPITLDSGMYINIGTEYGYRGLRAFKSNLGSSALLGVKLGTVALDTYADPYRHEGDRGFGLKIDTDSNDGSIGSLKLWVGSGLEFTNFAFGNDGAVQLKLDTAGLCFNGEGGIGVNIGSGLTFNSGNNKIEPNVGNGLQLSYDGYMNVKLGSGLRYDRNGGVENTKYEIAGVVDGVSVETTSTTTPTKENVFFDFARNVFVLSYSLKYYLGWASTDSVAGSVEWSNRLQTKGATFYVLNDDDTTDEYYSNGETLCKVGGESGEVLSFEAPMVKDNTNVSLPLGQGLGLDIENKLALTDDIIAKIQTLTLRQLYIAAGVNYNSSTGFYELNGVNDIDEEEMSGIYVESLNIRVAANSYAGYPYRTTLKLHAAGQNDNLQNVFSSKYLISLGKTVSNYIAETPSLYGAFNNSNNIRIASNKAFYSVNVYGREPFGNAKELVQVLIRNNKTGFTIKDSLRISYYSLNYLAANASGTAFTVTLPEAQANILYLINRDYAGDGIDDIEENALDDIGEIIATLPWEAKLKVAYKNPIWNEDNGGSILWDSVQNGGCGVPCEYYSYLNADIASVDGGFTDARPSLIKHATGADGSQIYASWVGYVHTKLASDLRAANTKIAQFTTATNVTFATSIQDWINLAVKFGEKNITIVGHTTT